MSGNITHSGGNFTSNGIKCIRINTVALKVAAIRQEARVTTRYTGMNPDGTGNLNDTDT